MKKNSLIVSCQALKEEPLHSSEIMGKMANAALQGGAKGIRANGIDDILEIKKIVDLPIIGIIKEVYENSDVYITPTFNEVEKLAKTNVEVIALDATLRKRPLEEELETLIKKTKETYPNIKLMADIATIEEALYAEKIGFDFIGTTLHGYTEETKGMDISNNDFEYLKRLLDVVNTPVIAEGKIDTPMKAKRVLELGVHCVVVGGAITRPQEITKKFTREMESLND